MAKARVIRTEAPISGVTLELTPEEAAFLRGLIGQHVAGAGHLRLDVSDKIYDALEEVGVTRPVGWNGVGTVVFQ